MEPQGCLNHIDRFLVTEAATFSLNPLLAGCKVYRPELFKSNPKTGDLLSLLMSCVVYPHRTAPPLSMHGHLAISRPRQ